jgi:hypothetical protein
VSSEEVPVVTRATGILHPSRNVSNAAEGRRELDDALMPRRLSRLAATLSGRRLAEQGLAEVRWYKSGVCTGRVSEGPKEGPGVLHRFGFSRQGLPLGVLAGLRPWGSPVAATAGAKVTRTFAATDQFSCG